MANTLPTYENNGPSDEEIEDQMIEDQIERQEEDLRGENGPEAQREAEEARRRSKARQATAVTYEEEQDYLTEKLGSPALVKACMDHFDYALKLRSGEVIRFENADYHDNGWLTLTGVEDQLGDPALPYAADRGVDIRLEEILWVMDAPEGS